MDVVITGAGGFSGSHVVPALLKRGHRVTAVVRRTRGGRLDPALGRPGPEHRLREPRGTVSSAAGLLEG